MMTAKQTIRRGTVALAATLAVAALGVPAALAGPQDVLLRPRQQDDSDAVSRYLRNHQPDSTVALRLDESDAMSRYLRNNKPGSTDSVRPDDRPGTRGVGASAAGTAHLAGDGFDWGDAGIGASFAAALLALLGSMLVFLRHSYRGVTP